MQNLFLIILFIFGTLFGSFSSVLIYRLQSGEKGILNGRSHCARCNHILEALDLIPVFSWLINKAKCKYCKNKISSIYPILEISTGILFSLVGYFLIDYNLILSLNIAEIIKLIFWLTIAFISIIYTFYDILFLEIHEGVMLSGIGLPVFGIIIQSFGVINIIPSLNLGNNTIFGTVFSILLLLLSLFLLYKIMLNEYSLKKDFFILFIIGLALYLFDFYFIKNLSLDSFPAISALTGSYFIFLFFFLQIALSGGKAMGGGDLRIAILVGLLLGTSLSFPGIFITYMVGSIIGIWLIVISKIRGEKINSQVPFGPFLAIGFFITIFYQKEILELLKMYF